ncbi:unnamed protein product [Phytophthora lilii]|uniref:Unnamed protein product n=1 Tax=Phytophthora lilii TaxID=2077276 RepID=A0A9W6TJK3_9STRA|nr:unnamed protein product [Phytophthora lilii]
MNGVRKIADSGRTIICTIYQQSTEVFNLFDLLLLLRRGGCMVFFGELGQDSKNLIDYFKALPGVKPIKPKYNPATWMLEYFADIFEDSYLKLSMMEDLNHDGVLRPSPELSELKFGRMRAASSYVQFEMLSLRYFRLYWRTPTYNLMRVEISALLACLFAIIFQGTDYSTYSGANAGVAMIFASTIFLGVISFNSVLPVAADERSSFYRERASQTYNAFWYFIAGNFVEIPYILLSTLLFCAIFFPSVGFTGYATFFYYWMVASINTLVFVYLGQLFVFALPIVAIATTIGALLISIFMLFAGFNPPTDTIPIGYKWIHWISPPSYSVSILVSLILGDCSDGNVGCNILQAAPPTVGDVTV